MTQVQVDGFDKNFAYLVVDAATHQTLLVDPCGAIERVFAEIEEQDLGVTGILITHTHFDHHDALQKALLKYDVPVYLHEDGGGRTIAEMEREEVLVEGDTVPLGEYKIDVLHTPGHLEDCVCYYIPKAAAADGVPKLITGDTLFVEGCGRTTSASVHALYESLQHLKAFPDETEIYPGHDYGSKPVSSLGYEKEHNKYLLAKDLEEFKSIRLPAG